MEINRGEKVPFLVDTYALMEWFVWDNQNYKKYFEQIPDIVLNTFLSRLIKNILNKFNKKRIVMFQKLL